MIPRTPLVSICIPSYNYARYLGTTIDSALAQTYQNFEILVSDNASTDDTQQVLEAYQGDPRIQIFLQPENLGIPGNVNFLLRQAQGDFIIFVGADDAMLPNYLTSCLHRLLDADDPVDLVYAGALLCNELLEPVSLQCLTNQVDMPYSHRDEFPGLLQLPYILFTATMFRHDVFDDVGHVDEETHIAFDWEFLLRLAVSGKRFASIPDPVILVRYHAQQASSSQGYFFTGRAFEEYLAILERMLIPEYAWRFRGYEAQIIKRLNWYEELSRSVVSLETLQRHAQLIARLQAYAQAPAPVRPECAPQVSVIVLSDGDPGLLERALDALFAQTFTSWEAVIVQYAGASLEGLVRRRGVPQRLRFSYGPGTFGVACVSAMNLARGAVLAYLPTGSVYRPEHLARAVASIEAGHHIVVSDAVDTFNQVTQLNYGPYRQARRVVAGLRDASALDSRLRVAPVVEISTLVHRRELIDRIGSWALDDPILGTWEWVLRGVIQFGLMCLSEATVEIHHAIGVVPIEKSSVFLDGIDEIYRRYPTSEAGVVRERAEYRRALQHLFAQPKSQTQDTEGMFQCVATIAGLLQIACEPV